MTGEEKTPVPSNTPPSRLSSGAAAVLLASVTFFLFHSFLNFSTQDVLSCWDQDIRKQFLGWYQFGFGELKKGHFPLWNPHLFCGAPFFGGFQSALLYPPNWLFLCFPIAFALNLSVALHVFLSGWFTFLWIRKRGSHPASACMAAFMYMFGAAYFLRIMAGHLPHLWSMAWIPLLFLSLEGWRDERKSPWLFLGAFSLAMQVFAGHIQYVYYTVLVSALYVLLTLPETKRKLSALGGFAVIYGGAALLAAVQLLAGWEAAGEGIRTRPLSIDVLDALDMTPERLWCLFMPNFFGSWGDYWGGGLYYEGVLFLSLTGWILALYALAASPRKEKRILGGIALFLTLLAVGKRTPLFGFFCKYFPLFGSFRGIGKINILISLCLIVLASMGMDEIFKGPPSLKGLARWTAWGGGLFSLLAFVFFVTPRCGGGVLFKQFLSHSDSMARSLLICGILIGLLALISKASARWKGFRWGFLALSFFELFFFAESNMPFFNLKDWTEEEAQIQRIYDRDPGNYRIWAQTTDLAMGTGGLDIWGEDPMNLYRYARFAAATQRLDLSQDALLKPFFHDFSKPLGLVRLRYLLKRENGRWTAEKTGLKEAPRTFITDRFQVLDPAEVLKKTSEGSFDFQKEVLLESDPGIQPAAGALRSRLAVSDLSTDKIEIRADVNKPAVLVVTDNYSRGWRVEPFSSSAQKAYRVMPANGFQRGIPLAPGSHHFLLEYRPLAFVIGKWVSILAWAFGALLLFFLRHSL